LQHSPERLFVHCKWIGLALRCLLLTHFWGDARYYCKLREGWLSLPIKSKTSPPPSPKWGPFAHWGNNQPTPQQGPHPSPERQGATRWGKPRLWQPDGSWCWRELPGKKQRREKCRSSERQGLSRRENLPRACTALFTA